MSRSQYTYIYMCVCGWMGLKGRYRDYQWGGRYQSGCMRVRRSVEGARGVFTRWYMLFWFSFLHSCKNAPLSQDINVFAIWGYNLNNSRAEDRPQRSIPRHQASDPKPAHEESSMIYQIHRACPIHLRQPLFRNPVLLHGISVAVFLFCHKIGTPRCLLKIRGYIG